MTANKVSSLTKSNCKDIDIERRDSLDFTDDGYSFRGFMYKGVLPITQHYSRKDKTVYLSVRVDMIKERNFTFLEWHKTPEACLCDEFNGVSEIDTAKLKDSLERILAKVNKMNEESWVSESDIRRAAKAVESKIDEYKSLWHWAHENFDFWNASSSEISDIKKYCDSLRRVILAARLLLPRIPNMTLQEQKDLISRCDSGRPLEGEFYARMIKELTEKSMGERK